MIQVLAPGMFSTIQDRGRWGFRKFGVPLSGVMDSYSAGLANMLLNNPPDTPVLEITVQGPTLLFTCATEIAIVGADIASTIDGRITERNRVIQILKGQQLTFGKLISGCRCYLAVKGGFKIDKVLDSFSFYPGISDHALLCVGMELTISEFKSKEVVYTRVRIDPDHFSKPEIAVQKGPEFEQLTPQQRQDIFENSFRIGAKNNRMGYQLEGAPIKIESNDTMLTAVTIPGTVQLTPAGNPIVLMRDCQTTGGYPRILQLTEQGINRLAQKKTNDCVRFELQEIAE